MPWNDARGYDQNAAPVFPQGAAFGRRFRAVPLPRTGDDMKWLVMGWPK